MTLTQNGTDVAGAVQLTGQDRTRPNTVTGVLKGDEIHLVGMASTGILRVSGNQMTGTLRRGGQSAKVIARRQTDQTRHAGTVMIARQQQPIPTRGDHP